MDFHKNLIIALLEDTELQSWFLSLQISKGLVL